MPRNKKIYIALFGQNIAECLALIIWAVLRQVKLIVITPPDISSYLAILKRIFFIKNRLKTAIEERKAYLGEQKGLWYTVSEETIDLTKSFYESKIKGRCPLISYYRGQLKTDKIDAYFKHLISNHIFAVLNGLHLIRVLGLESREILTVRNAISMFVIEYMQEKYDFKCRIKWILPIWRPFLLFVYYGWLLGEFVRRGIVINKERREYKISKEANTGFDKKTHRDDMVIDNDRFKKNDLLLLGFNNKNRYRGKVLDEAKKRGFDTALLSALQINITGNIFNILFFYFWMPLRAYGQLFLSGKSYFFYYIFRFHKECFPAELLMNIYSLKCHISDDPSGDIAFTIILNKYGSKNVIHCFSDFSNIKSYRNAFIAHNIFYVWSHRHYDFHRATRNVDSVVNTGCIFKREFNKGVDKKHDIIVRVPNFKKGKDVVTFFDDSFQGTYFSTEAFFLQYRRIILEFCKRNKNINVLLKSKGDEAWARGCVKDNIAQYRKVHEELSGIDNFYFLDSLWSAVEVIAISDVSITMGMHTPSTIALICGKNGLYFDNTGNPHSLLIKRHKNVIVFEDEELLFKQIDKILNGKFNCKDVISESEIREYDAFGDDNGVGRLIDHLNKLTRRKE